MVNQTDEALSAFGEEFGKVLDPVAGMPAFAVFLGAWRQAQRAGL